MQLYRCNSRRGNYVTSPHFQPPHLQSWPERVNHRSADDPYSRLPVSHHREREMEDGVESCHTDSVSLLKLAPLPDLPLRRPSTWPHSKIATDGQLTSIRVTLSRSTSAAKDQRRTRPCEKPRDDTLEHHPVPRDWSQQGERHGGQDTE